MAAALPFIAAGASLGKGIAGLKAGNANARNLREQAREEGRAASGQIRRVRVEARRKIGEQYAALAGNGFEGAASGGSALDALRESQVEAALDVLELRRQGVMKAQSLEAEARLAKRRGRFALVEGILGAGSAYTGMKSDWAQARAGSGGG